MSKKRIHIANETSKSIGRRIRELRISQSLSQKELAKMANISRTHISSVETGVENISDDAVARLANALSTSYSYLKEGNIVALNKHVKRMNSREKRHNIPGQLDFAALGWV